MPHSRVRGDPLNYKLLLNYKESLICISMNIPICENINHGKTWFKMINK